MRTDGGPQFTSYTFKKFMEKFNVEHVVSSPHYPQSVKKVVNICDSSYEVGSGDILET